MPYTATEECSFHVLSAFTFTTFKTRLEVQKTPSLKNVVFDLFSGGDKFFDCFPSLDNPIDPLWCPENARDKNVFIFVFDRKKIRVGVGRMCALSGQSSMPCSVLQLMKKQCEWSASREQFGSCRWPCDWPRVKKSTFLIVFDGPRFWS